MDRRQYLGAALAFGCSSALAGCFDRVDAATGSDADDLEVADRSGERALARSAGRLNEATYAFEADSNLENGEFDPSGAETLLATARESLEDAAEAGEDDVDELRAYAAVLEALLAVAETVTDDGLETDAETIPDAMAERRLENAAATVGDLDDRVDGADDRLEEAVAGLDALDADRLTARSVVDPAELEPGVAKLEDVVGALAALVAGFEATIEGYESLECGRERSEDGEHERAREAFREAERTFEAATKRLEDGQPRAPATLDSRFETELRRTAHLERAAAGFVAATGATLERDPVTARNSRDDAEAELEAADSV
ncbi:hypothetical protein [Natronococcus sp. A-GB7]|uniref:hypothetical protein n=1 Tax=Natronococcus sp. A-GB7 TaxID=3037649 RepID=UPI00241CF761|nr:hypothetical protein [Natronococcus sp. A-GB7]MDG5819995.1 hypothetical protein [Natronococcus sp. A-GB7]